MGALAIPLLEAAGSALSDAYPADLGGTATAGILSTSGDSAQDKSKAQPIARAVPKQEESCKKCPPDGGSLVTRNWNMSDTSREYQTICDWLRAQNRMEFLRIGLRWVSFKLVCQLEEAKAKYDQFFDKDTGRPKLFFNLLGAQKIRDQASNQSAIVAANPPSLLRWYFMQPISYNFFSRIFRAAAPLGANRTQTNGGRLSLRNDQYVQWTRR